MSDFLTDIKNTAVLARLSLDEGQAKKMIAQLDNILTMVNQINSVNTDHITPLAHPLGFQQPLRDDIVDDVNQRELFQQHAPCVEAGLYIVPKIIEGAE